MSSDRTMDLAGQLVAECRRRGITCGTAESCTGGGIGNAITAVPGASEVFKGGIISYANSVKQSVLGVSRTILDGVGPVSEECARAMAEGARRLLAVDLAVSVTGLAGPGGDGIRPAGYVWFAVASAKDVRTLNVVFPGDRETVRAVAIAKALELLLAAI